MTVLVPAWRISDFNNNTTLLIPVSIVLLKFSYNNIACCNCWHPWYLDLNILISVHRIAIWINGAYTKSSVLSDLQHIGGRTDMISPLSYRVLRRWKGTHKRGAPEYKLLIVQVNVAWLLETGNLKKWLSVHIIYTNTAFEFWVHVMIKLVTEKTVGKLSGLSK
jgi:hypothetical protein